MRLPNTYLLCDSLPLGLISTLNQHVMKGDKISLLFD